MTERKIALSIEEAADYTGIGRNTLRKLVEWKKLPVLKVGRKVKFQSYLPAVMVDDVIHRTDVKSDAPPVLLE